MGILFFFIASAFALYPLTRKLVDNIRQHKDELPDKILMWQTAALIALLFFYCNTEMHERYQHPAMIFLAALGFSTKRFSLYILFSFAYFWNLELYMQTFRWPTFIYSSWIVSGYAGTVMFGIVIISLYINCYRLIWSTKKPAKF